MPALSHLFIRTGLLYLAAGALLGGMVLWNKALPLGNSVPWLVAHISLVTWGWLLHLTLGVAYWILPRISGQRPRAWLAVTSFLCLNAGLWLVAASPWLRGPWPSALGGLLQVSAALSFALHAWPRAHPSSYGT